MITPIMSRLFPRKTIPSSVDSVILSIIDPRYHNQVDLVRRIDSYSNHSVICVYDQCHSATIIINHGLFDKEFLFIHDRFSILHSLYAALCINSYHFHQSPVGVIIH